MAPPSSSAPPASEFFDAPPPPQPPRPSSSMNRLPPSFPPPPSASVAGPLPAAVELPHAGPSIANSRVTSDYSVREYLAMLRKAQQQRQGDDPALEDRLRRQQSVALRDLRRLMDDVTFVVKDGESNRFGRWLLGGFLSTFIPLVRKLFRRSTSDKESANDTEHAFRKSKSLVTRILSRVRHKGKFAAISMFLLSVMYVFQAEVALRVARTIGKRLRKLTNKVDAGYGAVEEKDLDVFKGWRWRVLMWHDN